MQTVKKLTNCFLIDDDEDDYEIFRLALNEIDPSIVLHYAYNGYEALKQLNGDHHLIPNFIFIDWNMPKMNGKQTLKFLKSSDRYSKIPTVVYSTYADTNLIIDCKRLGALMVAVKPIDHEGYQKMMNDFLKVFSR